MNIRTFIYIISVCLFLSLRSFANEKEQVYTLSKIDYQQGLSNSSILCIFQDKSGLMWFGTYDGLNCYDGKTMEVFRTDLYEEGTLSNNIIYSIQQADSNYLWIYTHAGIDLFSPVSKKVIAHYELSPGYEVFSNNEGNTWIQNQNEIYYYNTGCREFIKADIPQVVYNKSKKRSFIDEKGTYWIFPEHSTKVYCVSVPSYSQEKSNTIKVSSLALHSKPMKCVFYQNGVICFIDEDSDLYLYDLHRESKIYIRNVALLMKKYGDIRHITPFFDDIVITFTTSGIVKLKASQKYEEKLIDQGGRLYCTYKDRRQGILWFGGDGSGAFKYVQQNSIANNILLKTLSPHVQTPIRGILTDKYGGLWIGTKGDGVIHIPDYLKNTSYNTNSTENYIFGTERKLRLNEYHTRWNPEFQVIKMSESRFMDGFWLGSSANALYCYLFKSDKLHRLEPLKGHDISFIHGIYEENDSTLWVTTSGNGFYKIIIDRTHEVPVIKDMYKFAIQYKQETLVDFFPLLAEGDSVLWLGNTRKGLVRFNKYTTKYQVISLSNLLHKPVDSVLSLHLHSNGKLYAGTTAGLVELSVEKDDMKARYIGRKHGLLNDMIHSVVEDKNGFLYLGTNRGLVKYNPHNDTSHVYYYTGGVEVGEFSDDSYYTCPYSGNLLLGGVNGLIYINKDVADIPDYYSDIVLRRLMIGREAVNLNDYYDEQKNQLTFHGGNVSFSLAFLAPDYLTGEYIEYSHYLEGYDSEWSSLGNQSELTYTRVPAGEYTLKIRYRKDVFDTEYRYYEVKIRVLPPWYSTWWAWMFYVLFSSVGGYYLYRLIHELYIRKMDETCKDGYIDNILLVEWNDRSNAIYQACERIAEDSISYEKRCEQLNIIREQVFSLVHKDKPVVEVEVAPIPILKSDIGWQQLLEKLPVEGLSDWSSHISCATEEQVDFMKNIILLIDANIDREDLGSTFIAKQLAISPRQLYRHFREISEMSPGDLIKDYRMAKAAYLLSKSQLYIREVISEVGIISRSHFYKEFSTRFGVTPKEYRDQYQEKTAK